MTVTLTFFFGLLMVSSFGRLGDLLDSSPSTGGAFFCDAGCSAVPSESATKDLGSSPLSGLKICCIQIRLHPKMCEKHCD